VLKLTGAIVIGSLALVVAGCGGGDGGANDNGVSGSGEASQTEQDLCAALTTLSTDLKQLQNLDPATTTTAEIETDVTNLQNAAKSATSAAAAESKVDVESIEADTAQLKAAVKKVPAGTSPKAELQQVKPQLDQTAELIQSTINGLACSST
jgi:DNA repair ATPase RecN